MSVRVSVLAACYLIGFAGCGPYEQSQEATELQAVGEEQKVEPPSLGVKDWSTFQTTLSRTPCEGSCPAYLVEINGDGRVRYCGVSDVKEIGWRTKIIPVESVRALAALFAKADFFNLGDTYGNYWDASAQSIWLSFDNQTKKVFDTGGPDPGIPAILDEIGKAIDDAADVSDWVGDRSGKWQERDPALSNCIKQIWKPAGALQ